MGGPGPLRSLLVNRERQGRQFPGRVRLKWSLVRRFYRLAVLIEHVRDGARHLQVERRLQRDGHLIVAPGAMAETNRACRSSLSGPCSTSCNCGSSSAGPLAATCGSTCSGSTTRTCSHAPFGAVKTIPASCCPAASVMGACGDPQTHVSTHGELAGAGSAAETCAQSTYLAAGSFEKVNAPFVPVNTRRGGDGKPRGPAKESVSAARSVRPSSARMWPEREAVGGVWERLAQGSTNERMATDGRNRIISECPLLHGAPRAVIPWTSL